MNPEEDVVSTTRDRGCDDMGSIGSAPVEAVCQTKLETKFTQIYKPSNEGISKPYCRSFDHALTPSF